MDRCVRTVLMALTLALPLAACESFGNYDFDPTDLIPGDLFSTKKKLLGERKPVFPEGVPGVSRGVPPELVKGSQPPPGSEEPPATQQASAQPPAAKPKPKAQPKPRPAPETAAVSEPSGQRPVDARWPDTPLPQRQQQAQPQQQQQQQPAVQWPEPSTGQRQQPREQVQWPDPPSPAAFPR